MTGMNPAATTVGSAPAAGAVVQWLRVVRSELRKLTSTRLPAVFLGVLVVVAALTGATVVWGTDMDGSKTFISTGPDQVSLMAFAGNALMGAALFGAVAVAREFGHKTVVPTYLASPRRTRTVSAQIVAVMIGGALLSIVGALLVVTAVATGLRFTGYGFLPSGLDVLRIVGASAMTGAAGAAIGAGAGALIRNTGGAVAAVVGILFVSPPLVIQFEPATAEWMPTSLAWVISGVLPEPSVPLAMLAVVLYGLVPAVLGWLAVRRRDVV